MSLRKRGGIWWVDVVAPNGERIRRTTGTASKALAQEYHDRLKSELWRIAKLGEKPRRTWNDAVVRWFKEKSHKATAKEDVTKLRWLDPFLGGKDLSTVTRATLDRITDAKLARGCSNATVNRTLELVRAILRKCVNEWEWLDRAPQVRMLKEPTRRIRFLTRDEARRDFLTELPEHLADMAAFSLATGLRAANVTGLQWTQVDLTRRLAWIHPDQAKARKAIAVPLNAEAMALVQKQVGKHLTHVFSFRGKPIKQVSTKAWYAGARACRHQGFSVARSAALLGALARAERHAAVRVAGVGRVGESGDGAALRAPRRRSPGTLRGTPLRNACRRGQKATAQIRHRGEGRLAVANSQNRVEIGAGGRSRTLDLRITNALLYQLSYTGGPAVPRGTLSMGRAPVTGAAELSSYRRARATLFLDAEPH